MIVVFDNVLTMVVGKLWVRFCNRSMTLTHGAFGTLPDSLPRYVEVLTAIVERLEVGDPDSCHCWGSFMVETYKDSPSTFDHLDL